MARNTARNPRPRQQRPSNITVGPVTIRAVQRKDYVEAQQAFPGEPTMFGRFRQEELVNGRRYIAVHWYCMGIATYVQEDPSDVRVTVDDGLYHNCTLIHWGL